MRCSYVIALAIALVLGACSTSPDHGIASWTFEHAGTAATVELPHHLDVPDHPTTYTLRRDFAVAPELRDRPLALVIPFFAGLATLTVDGIEAIAIESDPVRGYRGRGPKAWQFPAATRGRATVTLVLAVEHNWKQSGWVDTVPRVVPVEAVHDELFAVRLLNDYGATFGMFGLTLVGVLYLGIFAVDRRRKEYLWFAIQGLSAISYPLFLSGFAQVAFGRFDVVMLAILLPTAALASVPFTHETLKIGRPSRAWTALFAFNVVGATQLARRRRQDGRNAPLTAGLRSPAPRHHLDFLRHPTQAAPMGFHSTTTVKGT